MFIKFITFVFYVTTVALTEETKFKLNPEYEEFIAKSEEAVGKFLNGETTQEEAQREILKNAKNSSQSYYRSLELYMKQRDPMVVPAEMKNLPEIKEQYELELAKAINETDAILTQGEEAQTQLAQTSGLGKKIFEKITKLATKTFATVLKVVSEVLAFAIIHIGPILQALFFYAIGTMVG